MRKRVAVISALLATIAPVAALAQSGGAGEDPAQVAARSLVQIAAETALLEKCDWVPPHALLAARFQANVTYADLVAGSPADAVAQFNTVVEQAAAEGRAAACADWQAQAHTLLARIGGQVDVTLVQASVLATSPAGMMLRVTDAEKREIILSKGRTQGIVGEKEWDDFARPVTSYTEEMARSLCQVRRSSMPAADQRWCDGSETANPGLAPIREVFATGMEGFIKEFAAWHAAQRNSAPQRGFYAAGTADRSCLPGDTVWDLGDSWRRTSDGDRAQLIFARTRRVGENDFTSRYDLYIRLPEAGATRVDPDAARFTMSDVVGSEEFEEGLIVGALEGDSDMPADMLAEEEWRNATPEKLAAGRKVTADIVFEHLVSLGSGSAVAGSATGSDYKLVRCAE